MRPWNEWVVRATVVKALVFLILLSAPFFLAVATAQEPAAPPTEAVTTDNPDDVMLRAGSGPPQSATGTGQADPLDIQSVKIDGETEKEFRVTLQTKALPSGSGPGPTRGVSFDFEGAKYRVGLGLARQGGGPGNQGQGGQQGTLQTYDAGGNRYRSVASVQTQIDTSAHTMTFTVVRDTVVDRDHVPVRFGDALENVTAFTYQQFAGTNFIPGGEAVGTVSMSDRAPDTGFGTPFTFQKGRVGAGDLRLSVQEPVRVSNGEATTIVYKVDAKNQGSQARTLELEAREAPADWAIRLPALIRLEAGQSVALPIILSLPFTHLHGETAMFELHAQAVEDANSWSSVRLGVFWTDTPQPAGHHPQMWLHSAPADTQFDQTGAFSTAFPFRTAWLNALEETEEGADDGNVPAFFNNEAASAAFQREPPSGSEWTTEWFFPMSPALLIGVDLDPTLPGRMTLKIYHDAPAQEAKVKVRFMHCDPNRFPGGQGQGGGGGNCSSGQLSNRWYPIASGESPTVTAGAQETVGYDVPLAVALEGDLLPYQYGANVGLHVVLTTNVPANAMAPEPHPELVIKGADYRATLTLPLIEYHDPIDQAFESLGTLKLVSATPFEKKVNPGRTAVFTFEVTNGGNDADEVALEVHGENTAWVKILGDQRFRLGAGVTRGIDLTVAVPAEEHEGNRAELFLVAQSQSDATKVAAIRLRAMVVEGEDIPDESHLVAQDRAKGTPGPDMVIVCLAVLGLAWSARRRF